MTTTPINRVNIKNASDYIAAMGLTDAPWTEQNDALVAFVGERKPHWGDERTFNKAEDLTDAIGRKGAR